MNKNGELNYDLSDDAEGNHVDDDINLDEMAQNMTEDGIKA